MKVNKREVLKELLPRGNIKKRLVGNYRISLCSSLETPARIVVNV